MPHDSDERLADGERDVRRAVAACAERGAGEVARVPDRAVEVELGGARDNA